MSSIKIELSKKQIIGIKEFMYNYPGKQYKGDRKLTHDEMYEFLRNGEFYIPRKVKFTKIRKENLLNGEYVAVADETSKIQFYKNPNHMDLTILLNELQSQQN